MIGRKPILVLMVFTLAFSVGIAAQARPDVNFTFPPNGKMLTEPFLNVTGTATGSDASWFQGAASDFLGGQLDSVVVDKTGHVLLDSEFSENFDDNSVNTSEWTVDEIGGSTVTGKNKALNLEGTATETGYNYQCFARMTSSTTLTTMVSARLESFTGSGSGYRTHLYMSQDSSNNIQIGRIYDKSSYGKEIIEWGYFVGGSGYSASLGTASAGAHEYKIVYADGKATVYQDDVALASRSMTLKNIKVVLVGAPKTKGDYSKAIWDDLVTDYRSNGTLISSVHDTKCQNPELRKVDWGATTPTNTDLSLKIRSSSESDMVAATDWKAVSNHQAMNFPVAHRYIQYRVNMSSSIAYETPNFQSVTITYRKPVAKVEVSIDNRESWMDAIGTNSWYAELMLHEGTTIVYSRVTDMTGESYTKSVRVEVDMTPPVGGVLINGGDEAAPDQDVTLTFSAADRYGVAQVMIDNDPDFPEGYWRPYGPSVQWHLPWGDGSKTVYAKFMDVNGWESTIASDSIFLDSNPPIGSILINDGAEFTKTRSISLSMTAIDISCVTHMRIGESPDLLDVQWRPLQRSVAWDLSMGDGEKTMYVSFRDRLGHVSKSVQDSIILDTTPPLLEISIANGSSYSTDLEVKVGLRSIERFRTTYIQIGTGQDLEGTSMHPFATEVNWTFTPGDGIKSIYARAWDAAGNVGPISMDTIILDRAQPVVSLTINDGASFTNERLVRVTLEVAEQNYPTRMQLGEDPLLSDTMVIPFTSPFEYRLSEGEGTKTIYARVWDAAGNMGPIGAAIITLDMSPPTLTLSIEGGAKYTKTQLIDVDLRVIDTSPVIAMQLGEDPSLGFSPLTPFLSTTTWLLSTGDVPKFLYGCAWDAAGNVGPITMATIILDTTSPILALTINNGSMYTTARTVSISLNASDDIGLWDMQLGEDQSLAGSPAQPFRSSVSFILTGPDGRRVVYGRVRDLAGNIAVLASASIILDTTPPVSEVVDLVPLNRTLNLHVTWRGEDAPSGIRSYDLQYRDGEGPWIDWLIGTQTVEADLKGQDGHSYAFRVRAVDIAGNQEEFPSITTGIITIRSPLASLPVVRINDPPDDATVKGIIFVSGIAFHPDVAKDVQIVRVCTMDDTWVDCTGTAVWSIEIDTSLVENGPMRVRAIAFDGQRYSGEATLNITVGNPTFVKPRSFGQDAILIFIMVLIVGVVTISSVYYMRRRMGNT